MRGKGLPACGHLFVHLDTLALCGVQWANLWMFRISSWWTEPWDFPQISRSLFFCFPSKPCKEQDLLTFNCTRSPLRNLIKLNIPGPPSPEESGSVGQGICVFYKLPKQFWIEWVKYHTLGDVHLDYENWMAHTSGTFKKCLGAGRVELESITSPEKFLCYNYLWILGMRKCHLTFQAWFVYWNALKEPLDKSEELLGGRKKECHWEMSFLSFCSHPEPPSVGGLRDIGGEERGLSLL